MVEFRHLSRVFSVTVQDGAKVAKTMTTNRNMMIRLSIGTQIDDLEWPLSEIEGHCWFV